MMRPSQQHRNFLAFAGHRISGLALAIFLPFHFLVLGLALEGDHDLNAFLDWSRQPLVKLAETVLIFLLVLHLGFGLRLLLVEFFPQKGLRPLFIPMTAIIALLAAFGLAARAFLT